MKIRYLLIAAMVVVAGCQSQQPKQSMPIESVQAALEEGKAAAEAASVRPEPPPDVLASLMPRMQVNLGSPSTRKENRFDINVMNSPAREFFMSLVEDTSYNMVVHPGVDGDISLVLKNVTIPEVMETLRDVYGYEYQQNRSGFFVMPVRMQSRIFQVNYLNVKRIGTSEMRVSGGQMSETTSTDSGTTSENNAAAKIVTESEANFWEELRDALEALVNLNDGGRSVVITPQSGLVVVKAMPSELRDVENYLYSTQQTLQRQVILEAKIIEVELKDGFQSGINWGKMMSLGGNGSITLGQTGGGSTLDSTSGLSGIDGNAGSVDPANFTAVDSLAATAFGGVFSVAVRTGNFAAFIELLESQGNAQVLSSPRVSTVNNQKAVIKVGQDEYFVTDVSSTVTTSGTGGSTTTPDITLTPFFSGISLDVTPQIDNRGGVTLHIHPAVSEVTSATKTFTVDDKPQVLPLALSKVRESDSIVYARSGQIVVIGGLMQETASRSNAAPPGIRDVPVIGSALSHTKQAERKSELVILLKPLVIEGPKNWGQALDSAANRLNAVTRPFYQPKKETSVTPVNAEGR